MDSKQDKIRDALSSMDTLDDEQWTVDGSPKVDVVKDLGEFEDLSRQEIIDAAPKFSRESFDLTEKEPEEESKEEEVNTQGYNHPEIVAAQKEFEEASAKVSEAKAELEKASDNLSKVMDRLIRNVDPKKLVTSNVMAAIKASNESREQRVSEFRANRDLLMKRSPKSPLDEAMSNTKKVRPLL